MTRYLMPDRVEADIVADRSTEPGYVWLNHPELGLIQMADTRDRLTPSEPDNETVWFDPRTSTVWQRRNDWAPEHAPERCWYSTSGVQDEFWPDVCLHASDIENWVQLELER